MSIKMLETTFDSNARKLLRDVTYHDVSEEDEKILIDRGKAVAVDGESENTEKDPPTE